MTDEPTPAAALARSHWASVRDLAAERPDLAAGLPLFEEPWRAARRAAVEAYAPVVASGRRPADCYSDGWYDGWIAGRYGHD